MVPKLYSILGSPPVRAVLMCANALGIELELVPVNLPQGEHLKPDFLKKNPQHTVPVLEEDDGFILVDSHAIMGYLVAKYGKDDSLYPKNDYKQRAIIDHRLHFDCGTLFIRGYLISRPVLYFDVQPPLEKVEALREAFQILDQILADNKTDYIAGNSLSIADFSIVATVTSWSIFLPNADFPNLKTYVERIQKLPCYEKNKQGLAEYHGRVSCKLKN